MSIQPAELTELAAHELRRRLESVEEMVRAIREDQIDALVLGAAGRERIRTLGGADEGYRVFVEAMGEGAINVTLEGTILYCNRRFSELVNAPLEQIVGSSIFSFVEPHDEGVFRALMWEGGTTASARRDFNLRTVDQKRLPVLVTATSFRIDSVQSVCLLVTDLSDHSARLVAEAASRAKDRFFASLSHELRTPLTPAMMLVGSIADDARLPEELREDLQVVRRNLELEARLIDDLLDLSHVISGKLRVHPVPSEGHELIARAIQMIAGDAAARRVTMQCRLEAYDDCIVADQARLLQALWNLLKNAIKFSSEGGTVEVRSRTQDGNWIIDIVDGGIGIRKDLLPRLFNPFEQGDPGITSQYGGMGLGLAISKAVVDLHQGHITAHSDGPGKGAIFTIALPLASSVSSAPSRQ